jgi:hypothetical protein
LEKSPDNGVCHFPRPTLMHIIVVDPHCDDFNLVSSPAPLSPDGVLQKIPRKFYGHKPH